MAPIEPGLDDAIVPALAEQVRIREERGPGRGLGLGRGARDADMTDAGDVPEANRDTRTVRMDEGGGGGGEGEEDGDDVLDSQEDGVLRDFRRGLATDEDVKEFPRACKGMSDDALGEYLHTLKAAVVDCPVVEILCDVFELGPEDPDGMSPGERHAACWQKVDTADDVNDLCKSVETRMVCATGKIFNLIAEVEERRGQGLEVWMDTLFFAHSRVFSLREAVCSVVEARVPKKVRENLPRLTVRLSSGAGELKEYQRLLLIISAQWNVLKLRKGADGDDGVYARVFTSEGHDTHFWERLMSVEEWITKQTDTGNPMVWKMMTNENGNKKRLVENIIGSSAFDFAVKPKDRHVFAFANGIYRTDVDEFYPYPARDLPDDVGACRYFENVVMNTDLFEEGAFRGDYETGEWFDIPTEGVTKVLNDQNYTDDVHRAFWALGLGRMLYSLKELEKFEVMVFLKGIAGSGKSTLVRIVELIFKQDAGVLSNNIEPLFGLSQHKDKYCIYTYELNEKFALEQAEWLSLVSGEKMSLAQKYKDALSQEWKSPYLAAGNRMFCRGDNASQIIRRLVLFPFDKKPAQDDRMDELIASNIANILVKSNRAYRKLIEYVAHRNIHTCLPVQFTTWRNHAQMSSNPLITFLNTVSWVEKGDGFYCPWEMFQRRFNEWLRQRDPRTRVVFDEDFYKHVFTENGIQLVLERVTKHYPRGSDRKKRCFFLYGVDVGDESGDVEDFPENADVQGRV